MYNHRRRARQDWSVGNTVNVGFLVLKVLEKYATPGDYLPDAYVLQAANGTYYKFVPHNGLERCDNLEQARSW